MKKKILLFLLLFLTAFTFGGCASYSPGDNAQDGDASLEAAIQNNSIIIHDSNRKIIYKTHISIKSKDLLETSKGLKGLLEEGDWIEKEELTNNSHYIVFRIKTTRLETFIDNITGEYETTSFKLDSTDISTNYVNTTAKITTLEKEQTRLQQMYANATIEEMIYINRRLSEIETELLAYNRQLLEFDSLVDFSTAFVYIYGPKGNPNPPTYGKTLGNSFKNGWNAVVVTLKAVLQFFVTILPFTVVIIAPVAGIVVGSIYLVKRKKNKRPPEE